MLTQYLWLTKTTIHADVTIDAMSVVAAGKFSAICYTLRHRETLPTFSHSHGALLPLLLCLVPHVLRHLDGAVTRLQRGVVIRGDSALRVQFCDTVYIDQTSNERYETVRIPRSLSSLSGSTSSSFGGG